MVDKQQVMSIIQANYARLTGLGVSRIGLFGSVARGDAKVTSDIDILVEFSDNSLEFDRFSALYELQQLLELLLQHKVDLVTREGIKPRLLPYVQKDLIYAAA